MAEITIKSDKKLNKVLLLLQASGAALIITDGQETEITAFEGYPDMVIYQLREAGATINNIERI
jgi:hypothetical protein